MLCAVCNDDIFENDDIKCSKYIEYFHFSCAGMREVNFRKLAKLNKDRWCCGKCKTTTVSNMGIIQANDSFVGSNETLSDLAESVKLMSKQFDGFGTQLLDVLNSIKELKEENKSLRENNCKLYVDIKNLTKKVNFLEQKSIIH